LKKQTKTLGVHQGDIQQQKTDTANGKRAYK
jgi:hypothetical protein